MAPRKPSSPARLKTSRGKIPARSHSSAWGVSSFSTHVRTLLRNASCSSVNGLWLVDTATSTARLILESMIPREPAQGVRTRARQSPASDSPASARTSRVCAPSAGAGQRRRRPEVQRRGQHAWTGTQAPGDQVGVPAHLLGKQHRLHAGVEAGEPLAPDRQRGARRRCAPASPAPARPPRRPPYASAVRSPRPSRSHSAAKNFGSSAATASQRSSAVRYRPYEGSPPSSAPCPRGRHGNAEQRRPEVQRRERGRRLDQRDVHQSAPPGRRPREQRREDAAHRDPRAAHVRHLGARGSPARRRDPPSPAGPRARRSRGRALPARGPVRSVRSRRGRRRPAGETARGAPRGRGRAAPSPRGGTLPPARRSGRGSAAPRRPRPAA